MRDRTVGGEIHHKPPLFVGGAAEADAEPAPDRARCPVAAEQVARGRGPPRAGLDIPQVSGDPVAAVGEALELPAERHVDGGLAGEPVAQCPLELRLQEEGQAGHAVRLVVERDLGEHLSASAHEPHVLMGVHRRQPVAELERGQDAKRLPVERDRARQRIRIVALVDHEHAHAVQAQQGRGDGAHGAEAGDQHVVGVRMGAHAACGTPT